MDNKTVLFILKYDVYNSIDFPKGTIVKLVSETKFEVVKGPLKGNIGEVADGLKGWLLDHIPEHISKFKEFTRRACEIESDIKKLNKEWDDIQPTKTL